MRLMHRVTTQRSQVIDEYEHTSDWAVHYTRALIQNDKWEYLALFDKRFWHYQLPWWKVDAWEEMHEALKREVLEEIGCEVLEYEYIWSKKLLFSLWYFVSNCYKVRISWIPEAMEQEKMSHCWRWVVEKSMENRFSTKITFSDRVLESEHTLLEWWTYEILYSQTWDTLNWDMINAWINLESTYEMLESTESVMLHRYYDHNEMHYFLSEIILNNSNFKRIYTDTRDSILTGFKKVWINE